MFIRKIKKTDISRIAETEIACFPDPWSEKGFADALGGDNIILVAEDDGTVTGYIVLYSAADEGEIEKIAVSPKSRRKGTGEALVSEALREAAARGIKNVYLTVRASNAPAISLYGKTGFKKTGTRKNFYRFPAEDAYTMRCDL